MAQSVAARIDRLGRPLRVLRLSVTDRCNLRCAYCMPEETYTWLERRALLSFEELARVARVAVGLGVRTLRLTGGEPLLRRGLPTLIEMLPREAELALTTNGVLLAEQAVALREAGLGRVTVSLDTLRPERFARMSGRDELQRVLAGLDAAQCFASVKLNTVVMRGHNDDELVDLIELGRARGIEVRFIEYMDVGGATAWTGAEVVPRAEILARLAEAYGTPEPIVAQGDLRSAPAQRFRLPGGTTFGVIASTTEPFCGTCDRARVTADGMLYTCLYATAGVDLRAVLRSGAGDEEIAARIAGPWSQRQDRGAEERLALHTRGPSVPVGELRDDPHLEMHTRGG